MKANKVSGKVPFYISMVAVIMLIVLVLSASTLVFILVVSSQTGIENAGRIFSANGQIARERIVKRLDTARDYSSTAASIPSLQVEIPAQGLTHPGLDFFLETLSYQDFFYSIYIGQESGNFFQVIKARNVPSILEIHRAPENTWFIVRTITIEENQRVQWWVFLNQQRQILGTRRENNPEFNPTQRPWFQAAQAQSAQNTQSLAVLSESYVFNSLQQPGITSSKVLKNNQGVIGVDITLEEIQRFVETQDISPHGGTLVLDNQGRLLGIDPRLTRVFVDLTHRFDNIPGELGRFEPEQIQQVYKSLVVAPNFFLELEPGIQRIDSWFLSKEQWLVSPNVQWTLISAAPDHDFLGAFALLQTQVLGSGFILLIVLLPLVGLITKSMTKVLVFLAADALRIGKLEFQDDKPIRTSIKEFHQLAQGFGEMKQVLSQKTQDLNDTLDRLAKIIDLNIALSSEQDIDRLSELILEGARELSGADAGSLYLADEQRTQLEFKIVHTESLGFLQGGATGSPITLPPVQLFNDQGEENYHNVVTSAFHRGTTVNISDAYDETEFDFTGTKKFDGANNYRSMSFLTVPLHPRGGEVIGAMQLINAIDPVSGTIIPFTPEIQRFVEALAAGAATALYNRDLIETQKKLFEAMIQLVAGAIDAKSPYTGGHCARVPVIAQMLADKAQEVTQGPLAGFSFESEQEQRAFRIGAWLHDAGKVTTPDFVVDKAVKLETIYNRIHEVRTRFEVLLRDARIARHEAVLAGADPEEQNMVLKQTETQLQEDFAFLAECNIGDEFLSEEKSQRIRSLASRLWMRYFDDTLGLSWEEAERVAKVRSSVSSSMNKFITTPLGHSNQRKKQLGYTLDPMAIEQLLADKAEHIIPRGPEFERMYQGYDFSIPIPEALYNRGELTNMLISRGTLTEEERFKINEHVMQTIVMLEKMPLPRELKRVPEYAGTHHEALNGTGYPRRLKAEDLSIPARIMAIADIFEALTASDRPYKKAKTLSAAVQILYFFKRDGHIDPDLFDLFLTSGVYMEYAKEYLLPTQLDQVDVDQYVSVT
jgi:HD-GYP domain-containing protein (c-di-GMP phosphodiesterase class II)